MGKDDTKTATQAVVWYGYAVGAAIAFLSLHFTSVGDVVRGVAAAMLAGAVLAVSLAAQKASHT